MVREQGLMAQKVTESQREGQGDAEARTEGAEEWTTFSLLSRAGGGWCAKWSRFNHSAWRAEGGWQVGWWAGRQSAAL